MFYKRFFSITPISFLRIMIGEFSERIILIGIPEYWNLYNIQGKFLEESMNYFLQKFVESLVLFLETTLL